MTRNLIMMVITLTLAIDHPGMTLRGDPRLSIMSPWAKSREPLVNFYLIADQAWDFNYICADCALRRRAHILPCKSGRATVLELLMIQRLSGPPND